MRPASVSICSSWVSTPCGKSICSGACSDGWRQQRPIWRRRRKSIAQALVTLTAELARSYVEYRNLQNQLRITRSNLEAQQHTLKLTERLFNEGVGTRHDVVRARAQTETTEAQIPTLEAGVIATLRQLEVLIGRQPGTLDAELNASAVLPVAPARQLLTSPAETIRWRPDIRVAERRLAAATAMQGAAIAELFPKVSLSAFLGLRNTDIETLFKSAAFSYSTAANLLQPLLNFGRIQAGIDLAKAQQQEAYLAYEKAVLEALRETETTLTRYLKEEVRRQILARAVADQRESVQAVPTALSGRCHLLPGRAGCPARPLCRRNRAGPLRSGDFHESDRRLQGAGRRRERYAAGNRT